MTQNFRYKRMVPDASSLGQTQERDFIPFDTTVSGDVYMVEEGFARLNSGSIPYTATYVQSSGKCKDECVEMQYVVNNPCFVPVPYGTLGLDQGGRFVCDDTWGTDLGCGCKQGYCCCPLCLDPENSCMDCDCGCVRSMDTCCGPGCQFECGTEEIICDPEECEPCGECDMCQS